jgi:hypothetical protein
MLQDMAMPPTQDMAMGQAPPSGDPCTMAAMCAGAGATSAKCPLMLMNAGMTPLPGGYCTSTCNTAKNDQTSSINPACPGGAATCVDNIFTTPSCFAFCDSQTPCTRKPDYSCFNVNAGGANDSVCLPTALSECDPTKAGSCPQDGGVTTDAGTMPGFSCVQVGPDPVGSCFTGCSVFKQDCDPDSTGAPQACYETFPLGEGFCTPPGMVAAGMPCMFLNDCIAGYACLQVGMAAACRKFCGGPNNVPCAAGTCMPIFGNQGPPITVVGACSM